METQKKLVPMTAEEAKEFQPKLAKFLEENEAMIHATLVPIEDKEKGLSGVAAMINGLKIVEADEESAETTEEVSPDTEAEESGESTGGESDAGTAEE